jgi:hypothetical protein
MLDLLPEDLIYPIQQYLTMSDIANMNCISKKFNKINKNNHNDFSHYYIFKCLNKAIICHTPVSTLDWLIQNNARYTDYSLKLALSNHNSDDVLCYLLKLLLFDNKTIRIRYMN